MEETNQTLKKRPAVCAAWNALRDQPTLHAILEQQVQEIATLKQHNRLLADKFNQAIGQRDDWILKCEILNIDKDLLKMKIRWLKQRKWWQVLFKLRN